MPIGPKGEKRLADTASNAVRVMQIATGQASDAPARPPGKNQAAAELGKLGGQARAKRLSAKRRREIATQAAQARYRK